MVVSTDASDYGLGTVLAQVHEDKTERIVAFASRTLSSGERKFSTIENEALACVWAVKNWQTYLWGRKFLLCTDHQALTVLLSSKGNDRTGMRIVRWAARLLCFNYDVIYRPGALNNTADCLSRLPLPASEEDCLDAEPEFVAFLSPAMSDLSPALLPPRPALNLVHHTHKLLAFGLPLRLLWILFYIHTFNYVTN